ncbi:MAG: hypothetical protein COS35_06275, partial [Zetaproteobacteria bacterium CG02_land_8_20_14_3_00_50_9]
MTQCIGQCVLLEYIYKSLSSLIKNTLQGTSRADGTGITVGIKTFQNIHVGLCLQNYCAQIDLSWWNGKDDAATSAA